MHLFFLNLYFYALSRVTGQQQSRQRVCHAPSDLIANGSRTAFGIDHAEPLLCIRRPAQARAARFAAPRELLQFLCPSKIHHT